MKRGSSIIYVALALVWAGILAWQIAEHLRVQQAARAALVNRARDISTTLGLVIRSQSRFGGIVSQERMESALKDLVRTGELKSVALLNAANAVVASAGETVALEKSETHTGAEYWDEHTVTLVNLIDLGTNVVREGESSRPIIVLPRREITGGPTNDWRNRWRGPRGGTNATNTVRVAATNSRPGSVPTAEVTLPSASAATNTTLVAPIPPPGSTSNSPPRPPPPGEPGRPAFGRPRWMSEAEYQSLIEKQGLHSFIMVMSTDALGEANSYDFWLRAVIGLLGGVAAAGLAVAWRNVAKSSELQIRLVRASELNNHLKEMNLAAAGLAHETRNPLNIIRGQAQMIARQADASPEVRAKSRDIADEVDRVTAQLNEFINYSKPRQVRRAAVKLQALVAEVARALQFDLDDKSIELAVLEEGLTIEADEALLRQLLFNLLLNAVQAVEAGGKIQIVTRAVGGGAAFLDVRDNGPGVPEEQRREIFKPYFTTHQKGTGLGLAVVQQIVLAHGWEIACLANEPRGAIFRVSHLRVVPA